MRNLPHCSTWKSAGLLTLLLAVTKFAGAQAKVSAERGAEIAPFVQTTLLHPDWGSTGNTGFTAGVDYTRFIRSIVQPSLEFRMSNANGSNVGERTYSGGLKLQATIHGIHPYATILAGYGGITFTHPTNPNYTSDSSRIYSLGGGAEFNVLSHWKVRFDFTEQSWNIGPQTLTPTTFGVGVSYRLHFHNSAGAY
jgi:opacity protein-like surface antigen